MTLEEQLIRDEGIRLKPYEDSVGKTTIGVGRNLDDVGISQDEAMTLLQADIQRATASLLSQLPWTANLDAVRHAALVNMCFNMGIGSLCGFKNFLSALQLAEFELASQEMLDSKWAEQVGPRAQRLSLQIATGEWQ